MDLSALSLCAVLAVFMLLACDKKVADVAGSNAPDPEFDLSHSDPAAVELADSIMMAMGGRAAWNETRYLTWQPTNGRNIFWDKHTGNLRIETEADSMVVLLHAWTGKGRAQKGRTEITQPDSLRKALRAAQNLWRHDSLWLVLPFNLKGRGITLRYLGEDTLGANNTRCNLLELSLKAPAKEQYLLYVDVKDNLIKQWAYSKNGAQEKPDFLRPWDNYQRYGPILLSANRTDHAGPRNVSAPAKLAAKTFTKF